MAVTRLGLGASAGTADRFRPDDENGGFGGRPLMVRSSGGSGGECPSCRSLEAEEAPGREKGLPILSKVPDAMPGVPQPQQWPPSLSLADGESTTLASVPERLHDLKHDSSVLATAVNDDYIFAGTHDGEILVWSLDDFQLVKRIQAHRRSVLCLFLASSGSSSSSSTVPPPDTRADDAPTGLSPPPVDSALPQQLLVSSAGDAIISIWCPRTFRRLFEIYSTYDVGDIFSVAYSVQQQTLYMGAQDTSIQWVSVGDPHRRVAAESAHHPAKRHHRFFDSKAVGGTSTPRRNDERWSLIPKAQATLEVHPSAICQFAHYGYVYCMLMARGPAHTVGTDEEVLISGGGDGTVKIWRLGGGRRGRTDGSGNAGGLDSDGYESSDSEDAVAGITEVMTLGQDDGHSVLSLAIDASFLYCGKLDGLVELWDLDTQQRLRVIKAHDSDVMTLQMKWGYLWSASANGYAAKHSTVHYGDSSPDANPPETVSQKYQCLARWKAHDGKILTSAATAHKRSRLYITGANDEIVSVWRVRDPCAGGPTQAEEEASEDVMLQNLREFVTYKTVSSRPEFSEDCHRGATFLCTLFKRLGGEVQMLVSEAQEHNPVVYAKFAGKHQPEAERKRILFYGHYDVVAADTRKESKWRADPFAMQGTNGYLYGRGVSDNKGPIMAALYAVTDLMQDKKLESDIVFLIEGEEEAGSRGFQETVRANHALIGRVDYILLANSYWLDDETPCLTYGLRGVLHATVCVDSALPDLHSGVDGSYLMAEPLSDLTQLLAQLKGPRNRVMIPHFYDGVLPLQPEEEARFDAITAMLMQREPSPGPASSADAEPKTTAPQPDHALLKASLMSRWREPNLTLHRYKVSGPDGSLVSSHACANISLRLVPGQEVDDVIASLQAFLAEQFSRLESTNRLTVHINNKAEPWLGDPDNYIFRTLEQAIVEVWDMGPKEEEKEGGGTAPGTVSSPGPAFPKAHRPLYIREGGSIPAIRFLEKEFGAPAAHLPCGQASDAAHLDNERLRVVNLFKSREIFKKVFHNL